MSKISVNDLSGRALDYAVALAEGYAPRCGWMLEQKGYAAWQAYEQAHGNPVQAYSTSWAGDYVIDREKISTTVGHSGLWLAHMGYNLNDEQLFMMAGATRREAAMRCYVASKFGDEIELPRMNCTPLNEGTVP